MIRDDGTTTWEIRTDLESGVLNSRRGYYDTATGMTYQAQGLWIMRDGDIPNNNYFVFRNGDFFLPGYYEEPFHKRFWDESVKYPNSDARGHRVIYDMVIKTLGNTGYVTKALRRKSGFPEDLLDKEFLVTIDNPKLNKYLDLMMDFQRGHNRLLAQEDIRTLRDLEFEDPVTKKIIIFRNPDYLPEYDNLEFKSNF